ncbi:PQ loop repeat-domain-containing protein [Chlamydoabsidia padenii]|nr:PQ loop repeat-domain-containing protein [Chlamydoabsidia padenii]
MGVHAMDGHEELAEMIGYASIACWIVVFSPQFYENYKRKNTEGVSATFLLLWILGDLFSLLGAVLENLMLTVILLAVYYLIADSSLLGQVLYYRYAYDKTRGMFGLLVCDNESGTAAEQDESTPLINQSHIDLDHKQSDHTRWIIRLFLALSVMFWLVLILGSACFFFWPWAKDKVDLNQWHLLSQSLGWSSAILYCCSRIPQIMQNFKNESVEGLSLPMFVFSVVGNLTYCASIFLKSTNRTYLLINFPWLVGSGGTLFFDFTVSFSQEQSM